jgi:hypothetical protein
MLFPVQFSPDRSLYYFTASLTDNLSKHIENACRREMDRGNLEWCILGCPSFILRSPEVLKFQDFLCFTVLSDPIILYFALIGKGAQYLSLKLSVFMRSFDYLLLQP